MSLAIFRKKDSVHDQAEKALATAMNEVEKTADDGRKLQAIKRSESITERHRMAMEHTKRELNTRVTTNEEEMDRLTREYNERMDLLKGDNSEYALSLRALDAAISVFEEATIRKAVPTSQSLWDRVQADGKTIELVKQMFDQAFKDHPNDGYAAFADQLGWSREDAKALAYALAYTETQAEKKNVA